MSDTPRTDAAVKECVEMAEHGEHWTEIVSAHLARQLERQNAELLGHLKFAVKLLDGIGFIHATAQLDAMRAAIAKAESK